MDPIAQPVASMPPPQPVIPSDAVSAPMQIVVLLILLLSLCGFERLSPIASAIADPYGFWLVSALAIVSGADYVVAWSRRAAAESTADSQRGAPR